MSLYEEAKAAVRGNLDKDESFGYTSTAGDMNKGSRAQTMQGNMLLYMVDRLSKNLDNLSSQINSKPPNDISKKEIDARFDILFHEQQTLAAKINLLSDKLDKIFNNVQGSLNQQTVDLAKIAKGENIPKASIDLTELDKQRLVQQFEETFSKIGKEGKSIYKNSGKYAALIEDELN